METLGDFGEYQEACESMPNVPGFFESMEIGDWLYFCGLFDVAFSEREEVPKVVSRISESVDKIVIDSYHSMDVKSMQVFDKFRGRTEVQRYQGLVSVVEDSAVIAAVQMYSFHPISLMDVDGSEVLPAITGFKAFFQLGDYSEQSKRTIRDLWPLVKGIERSEGVEDILDGKNAEPGLILLVSNKDPIATGYAAFREAGLDLPEKRIYCPNRGIKGIIINLAGTF